MYRHFGPGKANRRERARILLAVLLVIAFAGARRAPEAARAVAFSVTPPIAEIDLVGGAVRTMSLTLSNQGSEDLEVLARPMDLELDADGGPVLREAGTHERSCAPGLTLTPERLMLEAGKKKAVAVKLRIPRGLRGGLYCTAAFEARPVAAPSTASGMRVGLRMGTLFLITLGRLNRPQGEIGTFDARILDEDTLRVRELDPGGQAPPEEMLELNLPVQQAKRKVSFTVGFRNVGPIHMRVKGSIVIMEARNRRIVDRVPLETGTGTVLPDGERRFSGVWENPRKLRPGSYQAEARVTIPGAPVVRRNMRLELRE